MPKHLPRLHNLAPAIFKRCPRIGAHENHRIDGGGREIHLGDFGDDASDYGWVIHCLDGRFIPIHIDSYCDLLHDEIMQRIDEENASRKDSSIPNGIDAIKDGIDEEKITIEEESIGSIEHSIAIDGDDIAIESESKG